MPYEDMLMLFSDSAYLSKGLVFFLISYEDKWVSLPYLTICYRGGGCLNPYEDELMVLPHST